jgi:hypothetical protein
LLILSLRSQSQSSRAGECRLREVRGLKPSSTPSWMDFNGRYVLFPSCIDCSFPPSSRNLSHLFVSQTCSIAVHLCRNLMYCTARSEEADGAEGCAERGKIERDSRRKKVNVDGAGTGECERKNRRFGAVRHAASDVSDVEIVKTLLPSPIARLSRLSDPFPSLPAKPPFCGVLLPVHLTLPVGLARDRQPATPGRDTSVSIVRLKETA